MTSGGVQLKRRLARAPPEAPSSGDATTASFSASSGGVSPREKQRAKNASFQTFSIRVALVLFLLWGVIVISGSRSYESRGETHSSNSKSSTVERDTNAKVKHTDKIESRMRSGSNISKISENILREEIMRDALKSSAHEAWKYRKVLTAFQEPPSTLQSNIRPLPRRSTSRAILKNHVFPNIQSCSTLVQDLGRHFVNSFLANSTDPWLPWIHDYFATEDNTRVVFIGQNCRNCHTGRGTEKIMEFWAPQVALFQPVPVVRTDYSNGTSSFRLFNGPDPQQFTQQKNEVIVRESVIPETRFICRFHWADQDDDLQDTTSSLSLSEFPFNYEYVSWRKRQKMFSEGDVSRSAFWISQLIFSCPVPSSFQSNVNNSQLMVDVIPIRTPPRSEQVWFTPQMVGPTLFKEMQPYKSFYNITRNFGSNHKLPAIVDSGRLANLPVCTVPKSKKPITPSREKPYHLVICTWTSASYHRRGEDEEQPLNDNTLRLREWLLFHKMVGFDHVVIYDNTPLDNYSKSPIYSLAQEFDASFVTHQPWSAVICNNNRPHHQHPGDRSSQYAAEASCRERYGPLTDWMAFIDTDEYLAPMMKTARTTEPATWKTITTEIEKRDIAIMKLKSGRNLPRVHLMDPLENQSYCGDPVTAPFLKEYIPEPCLVPRRNETFLKVYNCDSVKLPRPERFARAMKQIYRPDYVLSHFVHYSTVTEYSARYFDPKRPIIDIHSKFDPAKELFLDELHEGALVHARSMLPRDTMFRSSVCRYHYPKMTCFLGYECPDSLDWIDDKGREKGARVKKILNPHRDPEGNFCTCWVNEYVDKTWIPRLENEISRHNLALDS